MSIETKAKTAQDFLDETNHLEMLHDGIVFNSDSGNCDPKAIEYKKRIDAIKKRLLVPLTEVKAFETKIAETNKTIANACKDVCDVVGECSYANQYGDNPCWIAAIKIALNCENNKQTEPTK